MDLLDIVIFLSPLCNNKFDILSKKKYFINMELNESELLKTKDSDKSPHNIIIEKNIWLTRIRWIYTSFILIFFIVYNILLNRFVIGVYNFLLILLLLILGNIVFIVGIRKKSRPVLNEYDLDQLFSLSAIQLDFDLVLLSMVVFFSGGIESPVIILFLIYIMVLTFLSSYKKSFRNTFLTIIFILIIFLKDEGLSSQAHKLAHFVVFIIVLIFAFFISAYLSRNLRENENVLQNLLKKTRELSITDGLTRLYNQTYFFKRLEKELEESKKHDYTFSVTILDLDNFKNYNDNNGHIRGSEALRKIGTIMKKVFRATDILAKYGGDEFVIILPHTDKVGAFLAADRLREAIELEPFIGEGSQPNEKLTISLGIASFPDHGMTAEEIINKADRAMYFAKDIGKNKTILYSDDVEQIEE